MKQNLSRLTFVYVILLVLLGLIGYLGTGRQSGTALIPTFFGIVVHLAGLITLRSSKPMVPKVTLLILGLIGFVSTIGGVPGTLKLIAGSEITRPAAAISKSIMATISFVYCILLVVCTRRKEGVSASNEPG